MEVVFWKGLWGVGADMEGDTASRASEGRRQAFLPNGSLRYHNWIGRRRGVVLDKRLSGDAEGGIDIPFTGGKLRVLFPSGICLQTEAFKFLSKAI